MPTSESERAGDVPFLALSALSAMTAMSATTAMDAFLRTNNQRDLSLWRMRRIISQHFFRSATPVFFEVFSQFSRHADFSSWISLVQNFERSNQAVRRFKI